MFDLNKSGEQNLVDYLNLVNDLKRKVGQELTTDDISFVDVQPFGGNPPYNTQIRAESTKPLIFGKGPVRLYYGRIDLAAAAAAIEPLEVNPSATKASDYLDAFNSATGLQLKPADIVDADIDAGPVILVATDQNIIYTGRAVLVFTDGSHPLNEALIVRDMNGLTGP